MTNTCTYLPGEDVLPYCSLLYSRYMVLNEINDLKINRQPIPVQLKQEIYQALFVDSGKKVTKKTISGYLKSHGYIGADDEISGVDDTIKANLKPYHSFRAMLSAGTLSEEQVEDIILHAAYSEDKSRMNRWLENHYPALSEDDRKYILRLRLKEFGRLSRPTPHRDHGGRSKWQRGSNVHHGCIVANQRQPNAAAFLPLYLPGSDP